jgi:hypothetical protein
LDTILLSIPNDCKEFRMYLLISEETARALLAGLPHARREAVLRENYLSEDPQWDGKSCHQKVLADALYKVCTAIRESGQMVCEPQEPDTTADARLTVVRRPACVPQAAVQPSAVAMLRAQPKVEIARQFKADPERLAQQHQRRNNKPSQAARLAEGQAMDIAAGRLPLPAPAGWPRLP